MKFKLVSINDYDNSTVEVIFDAVTLNDVLEKVDQFLKGSGFNPNGELEYVIDDFTEKMED